MNRRFCLELIAFFWLLSFSLPPLGHPTDPIRNVCHRRRIQEPPPPRPALPCSTCSPRPRFLCLQQRAAHPLFVSPDQTDLRVLLDQSVEECLHIEVRAHWILVHCSCCQPLSLFPRLACVPARGCLLGGLYSRPPVVEAGAGFVFFANSALAFSINCCLCSYSRFSAAALWVALIDLWWVKP